MAFLLSASLSAFAAPIEINNHSFEQPPLGGGGNTWTNNIEDPTLAAGEAQWIGAEVGDKFIELIGGFQAEGTQHIGTAAGFYLTQNLGIPYEPNTAYTLTVGVGYRNPNQSGAEAFTVIGLTTTEEAGSDTNPLAGTDTNNQLEIDSLLASTHARVESVSLNDSVEKSFTDVVVELVTDDNPPAGNILIFLGDDVDGGRSHFDNVRLESLTALDPDGDKIPAEWETGTDRGVARGLDPDANDGGEDPDGDTITNFQEFELGTHPQLADTDGDGLNDNVDTEAEGLDPRNPDVDGDTLLDGAEIATHKTDPKNPDTDGDSFEDQAEVAAGTDPLLAESKPARGGAILLGANFIGGTADSDGAMVTASAGVAPQGNWNNLANGSGGPIIANNAEGEPSLLRVSWQTNGPAVAGDEPAVGDGNAELMHGNLFPRGEDEGGDNVATEITVNNIAYPLYDLYLYLSADEGGGTFTVNDTLYTVEEITPFDGTFVEAVGDNSTGNYLHLRNLEGDTLSIVGRQLGGGGAIGGFQIERLEPGDPSLLPIPELADFGVFEGNPGPQEITFRMLNPGAAQTLTITNTAISGDQAANFTVSAVPASFAPQEFANVTVTFNPTDAVGIYRGFLEISSNDVVQAVSRIPLIGQIKHANRLVAHYKMDETDGTLMVDASGNGYHGNYVAGSGSVTLGAESLTGSGTGVALDEGDDAAYAEIPAEAGLPTLAIGSYSFWLKQDAADVGTASVLFSRSTSPANPYAVFFESAGDSDSVTWTSEATSETLVSDGFLNPGEVFHVVYTYADDDEDGAADVEIYVNGVLNASEEGASGYPLNTVAPFQIGATAGAFGLTGVIDDFQIYETALSADQITAMYADPGSVALSVEPPNPLLAYWKLDEGDGTEVADVSPSARTGVVNSGSWVAGHTGADGDNAVELTGEAGGGSNVELPVLGETLTEITITGWINGVSTEAWTGLIQSRDGAQPIGLGFRADSGELTYTWNDNNANTYNFVSDLVIPPNEWTFVALTVTPSEGKLYLGAGGALSSAVNAIEHLEQESPSVWHLGKDACCEDGRNLQGAIDDVAIFNQALTDEQIESIFSGVSPADVFSDGNNILVNSSFEEPAVDNINSNNLGVVPTGWSQTGDDATWNVIRNDGTPYDNGVDTAADGSQVLDLNGEFEIFQTFTLTEASDVTFGASFANRSGHDGADPSTVAIYDAAGENLLSPEASVDTSAEPQPSKVWSNGEAVATNLPAGDYQIRIALNNWNNMDAVYANVTRATGGGGGNPGGGGDRPSSIGEVVLGAGDTTSLSFSSEAGVEYDVERSTDLIEWTRVDGVTADSAATSISVGNEGPVAFYRVLKK